MIVRGNGLFVAMVWATAMASLAAQQAAQPSLADLAREAEAAKATARKATRAYTNADLTADTRSEPAPAPAPAAGFMSNTLGKPVSAEEIIARSEEAVDQASGKAQPEEHWRGRAESLRVQIQKLQTRITSLSKPNAARDANAGAKTRNDNEVTKVQQGLAALAKQWAALEESARVAKIADDWLDPRPGLPQQ